MRADPVRDALRMAVSNTELVADPVWRSRSGFGGVGPAVAARDEAQLTLERSR